MSALQNFIKIKNLLDEAWEELRKTAGENYHLKQKIESLQLQNANLEKEIAAIKARKRLKPAPPFDKIKDLRSERDILLAMIQEFAKK